MVDAASQVLSRVLGSRADSFELSLYGSGDKLDEFVVWAEGGKVFVQATSPVALCRGAYHYLKHACHAQFPWSSGPIVLPHLLPDYAKVRVQSPQLFRYYLSVCTYGYSMPWWDWSRWERELDWMALHGINMPLLLAGQEYVWKRVFSALGFSPRQIAAHFCGPAYLPWHRLGNINGHMDPLPESWIESQMVLQRQIMNRARELCMSPVVPGFSGFVPTSLGSVRPGLELFSAEPWAGFEKTTYIDPRSDAFLEVGQLFMREYRATYGEAHHYLCETFAEQVPRLPFDSEVEDLRAIGESIWKVLIQADPEANWVMQGWPFYFAPDYWTQEKVSALLDAVPAGRAFVLDLATEELELWRLYPAMREKGWMFNVVHNYGQNTHLHGNLQSFIDRTGAVLASSDRGDMHGMGISPEGIDQNPVVYELLTDLMWAQEPLALEQWLVGYVRSRYGDVPEAALAAWNILVESVYGKPAALSPGFTWRFRPRDQPLVSSPDAGRLGTALGLFLSVSNELGDNFNFRRDLVDICKTWLGVIADGFLNSGNRDSFFDALIDLDRLMATREEHRLSTWLNMAKAMGQTAEVKALYEKNARLLITAWGGPYLFDYAIKEWAGLIADFHAERWKMWFDWTEGRGNEPNFASWELEWASQQTAPKESEPEEELTVVRELYAKYSSYSLSSSPMEVTKLEICRAQEGAIDLDVGAVKNVIGFAIYPIFGQGFRASYSFELSENGRDWGSLDTTQAPTCRGARASFESRPVRFIRVKVDIKDGSTEQVFQPVVWVTGCDSVA
ncbi:MAG TPA: alpha-N-acetylglucosaminidase [Fimbriimonadaceae bacterium]|jgi:alpha-N-acetylglucosaminidase